MAKIDPGKNKKAEQKKDATAGGAGKR